MLRKILIAGFVLFSFNVSAQEYDFNDEMKCLADNIYWEARNQSFAGMVAVGNVTMNRVNDPRYPDTICEVVKQGPTQRSWTDPTKYYPVRHRCQFSWYCDGKPDIIPDEDYALYEHIRTTTLRISSGWFGDNTFGSTHYHATYVKPEWAETKTKMTQIGDHIFYKWEK
jgi:spore germination cell wall hydrolase CwlJ-like protein